MSTLADPSGEAVAVTLHDTNEIRVPRAIFVGGAGNITLRTRGSDTDVVFKGVAAGSLLPVRPKLVKATGTTATDIVALY